MKTSICSISIALLLCTAGCKRQQESGPTSIHGYVISEADGRRVPFADVWLAKSEGFTALSDKVVAYKKAGDDGYFNFDFDAEEDASYFIAVEAKHYFKKDNFPRFTKGKNNKMDLPVWPKGYVRVNFINEPPIDDAYISVNVLQNYTPIFHSDTSLIGNTFGDRETTVTWWFKRGPDTVTTRFQEKIFIKALDTVDFVIKF